MKILTWNINGIRASKIPLKSLLDSLDADVICFQETKVTRDQLDEPTAIVEGYNAYFSFSKVKSGYSGVATFCKDSVTPVKAEEGLTDLLSSSGEDSSVLIGNYGDQTGFTVEELHALDGEGRTIITQHKFRNNDGKDRLLTIINVYCPRADPDKEDRKLFKIQFYELLQNRAEALLMSGSDVIVLGDINTSHHRIDHCDPDDEKEFRKNPGRQWLDGFLWQQQYDGPGKFVDTFRYLHPNETGAYTCWNTSSRARETNFGTRIDYIFANVELVKKSATECTIHAEQEGSDHCPVKLNVNIDLIPSSKCPKLCTKYMPEFAGKQQKLFGYFNAKSKADHKDDSLTDSQESVQQVKSSEMKRTQTTLVNPTAKKARVDAKNTAKAKQCSLMAFFGKGTNTDLRKCKSDPGYSASNHGNKSLEPGSLSGEDTGGRRKEQSKEPEAPDEKHEEADPNKQSQSKTEKQTELWKSLFKGPSSTTPLCKGHSEPCILRTVKKDSLNKGRQFWVCDRPEGHKTNPEARCDHFEWVTKMKKK